MVKKSLEIIPTTYFQNTTEYANLLKTYRKLNIECLRINCTRASVEEYIYEIEMLKKTLQFDILLDLPLPKSKPRLEFKLPLSPEKVGKVVGKDSDFYSVIKDQIVNVTNNRKDMNEASNTFYVTDSEFIKKTQLNETVVVGEQELILKVIKKNDASLKLIALCDGLIPYKKYVFSTSCKYSEVTDKIKLDSFGRLIEKINPNIIALSFIENGADILRMRHDLGISKKTHLMSKIETGRSIENLEDVINYSDSLMIARGDLLNHVGEYDFCNTIETILKVNGGKKPIYVATGILSSLTPEKLNPNRAELTDLYYYLKNHVDGFILTFDVSQEPEVITKSVELINKMVV